MHVVVVGAGPAGLVAALRAGDLGARVTLVTRDELGGMAAYDGPVPVRTLAHAARLLRDARQLEQYGVTVGEPRLDYPRLLARVREVVRDVGAHATLHEQLRSVGVACHAHAGRVRLVDRHTLEGEHGLRLRADKIILCTGGVSRRLEVPGVELTATHSDAWSLTEVPPSLLVIGAGATGVQVASIFHAFGARVELFQSGPRILPTEDEDVSAAVAAALRRAGVVIHEAFGAIASFAKTANGVCMRYARDDEHATVEATLAVLAVGWTADTAHLGLTAAGVATDRRGFVRVDARLQTSAPHVFAAGDVTGRLMLVPQALQDGYVAGTNAVLGPNLEVGDGVVPIGSFTDPEYAQVGLNEAQARAAYEVVVTRQPFDATTRTIIDGHTEGFCKLIVDRPTRRLLGCHVVGDRAVDIVQTAAIAMAAGMRVDELARVPLSFPTYTGILGRAAARAAHMLTLDVARGRYAELL